MRQTLAQIRKLYSAGEKIVMLTCYDASFAALAEEAGVECLLVGDSLGTVVQGRASTIAVTLDATAYHVECVARGAKQALVIGDMPFGTFQVAPEQAYANAVRLMVAGAQVIKLEGGRVMRDTMRFLVDRGIPVCGHVGLTPQSVHQLGGFRVQGGTDEDARGVLEDARAVAEAGGSMVVLEAIPAALAKEVTAALPIPTIGIGAGVHCSGQVLVLYDMLDIYPGRKARFVKNFMAGAHSVQDAMRRYVEAVKSGAFPGTEHSY